MSTIIIRFPPFARYLSSAHKLFIYIYIYVYIYLLFAPCTSVHTYFLSPQSLQRVDSCMSESLETYTCGEMTSTLSLLSKGVRPLDHWGEGLTHQYSFNYSKDGFSTSGHPSKGRGMPTPRIHCYAALDTTYSLQPNKIFVSLFMPRLNQSILPVFKRLAACFDPSHQPLTPPAHALYRYPLT